MKTYIKLLLVLLVLSYNSLALAQDVSAPVQIFRDSVNDTMKRIDDDNKQITIDQSNLTSLLQQQTTIANAVASTTANIDSLSADVIQKKKNITYFATTNPPNQDVVALCNAMPQYCYNWTPMITNPSGVNWDEVASLHAQGYNWTTIQTVVTGVNWSAVNQINNINWTSINVAGINWNDWQYQEAQGVNWQSWILGGGQ